MTDPHLARLASAVIAAADRHECDRHCISAEFRCAVDELRTYLIAMQERARGAPELMIDRHRCPFTGETLDEQGARFWNKENS